MGGQQLIFLHYIAIFMYLPVLRARFSIRVVCSVSVEGGAICLKYFRVFVHERHFLAFMCFFVFTTVDFHKSAPYVVSGSVDQTVKIWECR